MKTLILALALACSAASANEVTITDLRANTITRYAGCEIDAEFVPLDRENSVLTSTCDEAVTLQFRRLEPARFYSPMGSVAVAFQGKFYSSESCNLVAIRHEGVAKYYFQCF